MPMAALGIETTKARVPQHDPNIARGDVEERYTWPMNLRAWMVVVAMTCLAGCDDGPDDSTTDEATTDGTETTGDATTTAATTTTGGATCMEDSECESGQVCKDGMCAADPGSFWVVGDQGAVLNVQPGSDSEQHPSPGPNNLAAITCYGNDRAWYVGEQGAAGTTENGGKDWQPLALETTANLHDVASGDPLRVVIVGDGGALLTSHDGQAFTPVSGAEGVLTGVDLTPNGVVAVGEDGRIWAHETGSDKAIEVADFGGSFAAVDFGDHTPIGMAVGSQGRLMWSEDGGYTWAPRETGTESDLLAVQVASSGNEAIAVGTDGVVVRITGQSIEARTVDTVDLQAVHLDAWGRGAVVGNEGRVLHTVDSGNEFVGVTVAGVNLLGVDSLGERHW